MALEPGARLSRYEIVAPAGAGGMGEVYRARDTRLDRTVAIKVLPEDVASDPSWQARFEREARSVSGLNHPRICALYDVGSEGDLHFLVMEYLEGETLAARLQRGALDLADALTCATQIAEALAAAHRAGIMHRDLKPGNVMLTRSGAKLMDFGLAKPLQAAAGASYTMAPTATSPLTAAGSMVGTFQYMAPEVLEGSEADARSDIFAFGAVVYEMVTGRAAFHGKTQASVVAGILKEEVQPLSAVAPASPPPLDGEARPLPGTEGGSRPFWSPDSRSIAFFVENELRRIDLAGGPAIKICDTSAGRGGTWSDEGTIVFAPGSSGGLFRVAADGGTPEPVTELGQSAPESSHRYPAFLPDGRHFLYLALSARGAFGAGAESENRVMLGSLDGGAPRLLMQGVSNVVYAGGSLVFRRGTALQARPFDPGRAEFTGEARTIAEAVQYDASYERAIFSASSDVVAYVAGTFSGEMRVRIFDRSGNVVRSLDDAATGLEPRFSPDGRKLAMRVISPQGETIWTLDIERGTLTRLAFEDGVQWAPVWSPDGTRVAYASATASGWGIAARPADGGGEREVLLDPSIDAFPGCWTADGRYLLFAREGKEERSDIWTLDFEDPGQPRPLLESPYDETFPAVSRDMRWLAYTSDESGRPEVYVTRFPSMKGKWLVSSAGGMEARWDVDGRRLFYRGLNHAVMEVPLVAAGSNLEIGTPHKLFSLFTELDMNESAMDLSPDGKYFVANTISEEGLRRPITVIAGWR